MMHKFSKTGEYAKKRLKIALAEDRSAISASDNMAQIKKEIKSVIQRHMNINSENNGETENGTEDNTAKAENKEVE